MKKSLYLFSFLLSCVFMISCQKSNDILAMLQEIKQQNSDLKAQVTALQKTSDSLALALKGTNQSIGSVDKKIDSIRNQLVVVLSQINTLNSQMSQASVNIIDIQAKIAELQAKCTELYNLLYSFINSGSNPNIQNGLVGLYLFSGNTLDSSGNANHGQPNNVSLTTDRFGRSNKAYYFNGIDAFIDIPNKLFDNGWDEYSISLWFRKDIMQVDTRAGHTFINTNPHNGIDIGYDYQGSQRIYIWKHSNPGFRAWDIFSNQSFNTDPITSENWYSVIVVKSGPNFKFYVNGILDNELIAPILPVSYFCSMRFGAITEPSNAGIVPEGFKGGLDDIRIYNRALTQSEITYLATH